MNPIYVDFNRAYSRKSDCKSAVYVYTIVQREKVQFSTGILVAPDEWDNERCCVKENVPNASDYNLIINSYKARITDIFVAYKLRFDTLTPERLKYEFKLAASAENFIDYALFKLKAKKSVMAEQTYAKHTSQINKLKEFAPNIKIRDLDKEFLENYIAWLRKEKKNKQTTIKTSTNVIKTYANSAVKDKLLDVSPFKEVKISAGNGFREFLLESELLEFQKIYNEKTLSDKRQEALRAFLLSCYTGLRLSDVKNLTYGNIIRNEIFIGMQKTMSTSGKIVRVPLCEPARKLIFLRQEFNPQKKVFQLISEQKIRVFLKELCKKLEIDKNIVFHSGRHTFATIFLRRTNNLLALKELLGHSKIEQTLIYSHLIKSDVDNDIKCFDDIA